MTALRPAGTARNPGATLLRIEPLCGVRITLRPPGGVGRPDTLDPAAAGETMIGQARRSRECGGDGPGRKPSPEIMGVGMWDQPGPKGTNFL